MVNRVPVAKPDGSASREVTWPVRSGACPALALGFVARPESVPGLEQVLTPGRTVALIPEAKAPPAGYPDWLGSCGKTQLAVYVAETMWRSGDLDLLVWINATSESAILSSYADAAVAAIGVDPSGDAESLATRFVSWLAQTSRSWLVVLDGLSVSWDMAGLWPAGPTGRTLITTAGPTAGLGQQIESISLGKLTRREALSYLLGRLTEDRGQRTGAIDLVDQLGGEPLALAQVSAVVEGAALSCRDYLDHFDRKRGQLALPSQDRATAAAVTWTLSVEQAYRLLPNGLAQPLLILAAMLDHAAAPGTVFAVPAALEYAGGEARGLRRPEDAWAALLSLEQAGLISIDQGRTPPTVSMSEAIAAAIKSATSAEMLEQAAMAAVNALLQAWPADDSDADLARSLRACADQVAGYARDLLWRRDGYRLLFRVGRSLEDARLTRLAAAYWSEIAETSERVLGPGHPDALAASDHLATAFLTAGRAADALPWFRRVAGERAGHLGTEHPAAIAASVRLGRALLAAGLAADAVSVLERAVSDSAHVHGAEYADTLDARDALAAAYCAAGQSKDGIRQYQRTLADRERVQGSSHPATMATCLRLADAFLAGDRIKEALAQYKRVVTGRERVLGNDHPATIAARGSLASAYHLAGRMATALQLYEQARADSERILGTDHPDTLTRRVNLAHAYYAVGRIGDAATLLRDTAERCDRVLSPRDPLVRTVRESLANISGG